MPITTIASGRAFTYKDNLGRIGVSQTTFWHPVGLGRGANDVLYVLNFGYESTPCARITMCTLSKQEWIRDIGSQGKGPGQFQWPGGLAVDSKENLYVTDQANSRIVSFRNNGDNIANWGSQGSGKGQFNLPVGVALDADENLVVVDSRNHRVQRYTKDGKFISQFGEQGSRPGQLNLPWGVALDKQGNVYVADWGNSRVQRFSSNGKYIDTIAQPGKDKGQVDHPSAVAVDKDGDIYVGDWGNERVIIFDKDGGYLATIVGDAMNLSRWAQAMVDSNPDLQKARARVNLEPEWRLRRPADIHVGNDYLILIAEAQHMRVQVYQKDPKHQEAQFTL
jgi:DNA-binding beta-propeller fold protein YncE